MLDQIIAGLCDLVLVESLGDPDYAKKRIERVLGIVRAEWRGQLNPGKQKEKKKREKLAELAAPLYAKGYQTTKIAKALWRHKELRKFKFKSEGAITRLLYVMERERKAETARQEAWKAAEEAGLSEFRRRGIITFLSEPQK